MDSSEKVILNKSLNKSSKNDNMSLNITLSGNKKLLPDDGVSGTINLYDEYIKERKNSNKFRLVINISPYCSNVLFNPFTEIVKYNKKGEPTVLNYKNISGLTTTVGKDSGFTWTAYDAIRDTQLSNNKCDFTYYCGLDIFNNHILRSKSLKAVNYSSLSKNTIASYDEVYGNIGFKNRYIQENKVGHKYLLPEDFNTIDDYMRDRNGVIISDSILKIGNKFSESLYGESNIPFHLYQTSDVSTFENAVKNKLIENNGWFGFINNATINSLTYNSDEESSENTVEVNFDVEPNSISACSTGTYSTNINITLEEVESENKSGGLLNINKVINNKKYGDFIDMYPTRELFSFSPLYNEYKDRYEKNWNYCLTYPSESIKKDFKNNNFPFFSYLQDGTTALKTITFDEYTVDDDGRNVVTLYSICEHGLKVGDNVNVYKNDELFYNNASITRIIDKYIFQIYKDSSNISDKWVDIDEITWSDNGEAIIDGINYSKNGNYLAHNGIYYRISESRRCNIDDNAQNISFKRVVNNVECEYYVRVFSRLPNFKFVDREVNDYTLYGENSTLIKEYSKPNDKKSEFENQISDLSFAETAYGDKATEILFTDDIDVSYLKDNLGRPLSEIYFTIAKNNEGFREWYSGQVKADNIEQSHCFGYLSSSFLFNEYYRTDIGINSLDDVRDICSKNRKGLQYKYDNSVCDGDEISFNEVLKYYGDICYYSSVECDEYSLQSVMSRFNTVQREINDYENKIKTDLNQTPWMTELFRSLSGDSSGTMFHDEIIDDESGYITTMDDYKRLYEAFNESKTLHHSSFHLDERSKNSYKYKDMLNQYEGYYYKMHYRIPIKTVSSSLNNEYPIEYEILPIKRIDGRLNIKTIYENNLSINDKLILYNKTKNKFYYLTVEEIKTKYYFICSAINEDLTRFEDNIEKDNVSLLKKPDYVPEYAKIIKDGSCRFYWREIISNGIEENDSKIYPFTNGAFYINRNINFFLRRQDPYKENLGKIYSSEVNKRLDYVPKGEELTQDYYDEQYYNSEEIESC